MTIDNLYIYNLPIIIIEREKHRQNTNSNKLVIISWSKLIFVLFYSINKL